MTTLLSQHLFFPPRLRTGVWWPIRRRWLRFRSVEIVPDQLRVGDKLLYDHPETGPYWTQPITSIEPSLADSDFPWMIGYRTTGQLFPLAPHKPLRVHVTNTLRALEDRQ